MTKIGRIVMFWCAVALMTTLPFYFNNWEIEPLGMVLLTIAAITLVIGTFIAIKLPANKAQK